MLRGNELEGPCHFKPSMMLSQMDLESLGLEIKCLNPESPLNAVTLNEYII